jgi:hypothetical protein
MTTISNLHNDQRYLFYKQMPTSTEQIKFRANFIDIIGNTIRVRKYCINNIMDLGKMVTMPKIWIVKIETLEEITKSQLHLPSEILRMIDEYI